MAQSVVQGDLLVRGSLVSDTLVPSAGCVADSHVAADAEIQATKLEHQHAIRHTLSGTVAAATVPIHVARAAGEVVSVEVVPLTAPTGGDKAFTVDLKAGNQSTALATLLASALSISNTTADRQVRSATLGGDPTYADGDTLALVIATSGSTGTQASDVVILVTLREAAD